MNFLNIKSLTPDPVLESIVEYRFESTMPLDAVFGVLYNALVEDFSEVEQLPEAQIPEQVRLNDPNLACKPLYVLKGKGVHIKVGPQVVSINNENSGRYTGWTEFFSLIKSINEKILATNVIREISRTAVRYLSFFQDVNIYDEVKLDVELIGRRIANENTSFVTEIRAENLINRLQIQNNVLVKYPHSDSQSGSIVDIDTYSLALVNKVEGLNTLIEQCHDAEKKLFFSLLKNSFLESLNPQVVD